MNDQESVPSTALFESFLQQKENNWQYRRHKLTAALSSVIDTSADPEQCCRNFVLAALAYHSQSLVTNHGICRLGNYHNSLYAGARLSVDWRLSCTSTVCALLQAIFGCEGTFERLFVGALFGTKISHLISGWRSDFETDEKNLLALEFFMRHSTKGREVFYEKVSEKANLNSRCGLRFSDVPLRSYDMKGLLNQWASPVYSAAAMERPATLLLLLRYGAELSDGTPGIYPTITHVIKRLTFVAMKHPLADPDNGVYSSNLLTCLRFLLRAVPHIKVKLRTSESLDNFDFIDDACVTEIVHPRLILDDVIPSNRYKDPAELQHLCRCAIRQCLHLNWQLPEGITQLPLPKILKWYVDLLMD